MNKITVIGRWVKDLELKFTLGNGTAVATSTIAIDRRFKKEGQQEADFVPVVIWGKQAESTAKYTSKGSLVGISGRIQTRNYENKQGNKVYITEIVVEEVQFLESKKKEANIPTSANNTTSDYSESEDSSDIPF